MHTNNWLLGNTNSAVKTFKHGGTLHSPKMTLVRATRDGLTGVTSRQTRAELILFWFIVPLQSDALLLQIQNDADLTL